VASALADPSGERQTSAPIVEFLTNAHVRRLIADPAAAFPAPSAAARTDLDTLTSAVNAPPSPDGRYNVATMRAHAQWLSARAGICPVAALRIVVVEFQSRAATHLAAPLTSKDMANLREAAGLGNGQDSVLLSTLGATAVGAAGDAESLWARFESDDAVRLRVFETYLSERRHLMMALDRLHSVMLYGRLPVVVDRAVDASGGGGLAALYKLTDTPTIAATLKMFIGVLEAAMDRVEKGIVGSGGGKDDAEAAALLRTEHVLLEWSRTALVEVVHALSAMFQVLDARRDEFAPSALVGEWFSLMEAYAFFDKLEPVSVVEDER
jgi:nuclear pore complex protein Nup188